MVPIRPRGGKCVVPGFGEDKPVIIQGELVAGECIVRRHIEIHPDIRVLQETVAGEDVVITEIDEHDSIVMVTGHVVIGEGIADRIIKIHSFPRVVADRVAFQPVEVGELHVDSLIIGREIVIGYRRIGRLVQVDARVKVVFNRGVDNSDVMAPARDNDSGTLVTIYMTYINGGIGNRREMDPVIEIIIRARIGNPVPAC